MASKYEHLINIIFESKGAKPTAEKIKRIKNAIDSIDKPTRKAVSQMGDFEKALRRVAIVVPVWAAARFAFQSILAPIKEMIKALLQLDAGLAKVATVSRVSASEQKKFFSDLTAAAWKYYRTSSASMKEITEAMYQIGTAGGTTTEILQGFVHVLNLSIATFGDVVTAGRVATGLLNVFGSSLDGLVTSHEKLRYISDLLVKTWSQEQVELNEIASAIGYVGSAADMLDIDMKTLVRTIGFLNTGLLRGSKSGTSLLNAFLQISNKMDKLRDLGIVFDPKKPLNLVNIMKQLRNRFEESGKSLEFNADLFNIFGKRGGRAIAQIIDRWEEWIKTINISDDEFRNFAENMKEQAETTFPKAFGKWFKLTFLRGDMSLKPITNFFDNINKKIIEARENFDLYTKIIEKGIKPVGLEKAMEKYKNFPELIAPEYIAAEMKDILVPLKEFYDLVGAEEIFKEYEKQEKMLSENTEHIKSAAEQTLELLDSSIKLDRTWEEVVKISGDEISKLLNITKETLSQTDALKKIYEHRKKNLAAIREESKEAAGLTITQKKALADRDLETKYALMKIANIEDEKIAYIKIADKIKEINDLVERENRARKGTNSELYQTISVSDVIAGNWDKILKSSSTMLYFEKDILELEKLRSTIMTSLAEKYQNQVNTLKDLALQYEKATGFEKSRLRRVAELAIMRPEELKRAFESSLYDKNLILDYWNTFSDEGQDAIISTFTLFKDYINRIPKEKISSMMYGVGYVPEYKYLPYRKETVSGAAEKPINMVNITNKGAENIEVIVNAERVSAEELANLAGEKVKETLISDESFQDVFIRKIRNKL